MGQSVRKQMGKKIYQHNFFSNGKGINIFIQIICFLGGSSNMNYYGIFSLLFTLRILFLDISLVTYSNYLLANIITKLLIFRFQIQ